MTSRAPTAPIVQLAARLAPRFILGAIAAAGVAAWAGCSSGSESRYYCDADGCYTCDAYGCSSVTPPAQAACTGNASCKPGEVCTTSGCATMCSSDANCPQGTVCKSNACVPPSSNPDKKECTTKSDCGANQTCTGGTCQTCGGTSGPCPCATKSDCSEGNECVQGSCTPSQNVCKFSSECGTDKVCADGQCLAACDVTPCTDGFTCDKGVCKPTTPPACTGDTQCSGETPKCLGGSCVKPCTTDPECGEAGKFYCNQGACAVDTRPKPNCTGDAQCSSGGPAQKCVGGFCKYTCDSDQTCRSIDNRIGYCAKDGVCRNATEAAAACVAPSDCSGQSCIDNQCR